MELATVKEISATIFGEANGSEAREFLEGRFCWRLQLRVGLEWWRSGLAGPIRVAAEWDEYGGGGLGCRVCSRI
ncbi:unnamed protein product [Linum trigynum]|uniref:Uncharacterized protein n=1 Tax=Linum trigynum TaxID=586398 RepID=A0AAV2FP23_9ROSI